MEKVAPSVYLVDLLTFCAKSFTVQIQEKSRNHPNLEAFDLAGMGKLIKQQ
jgi:hypothetical protein